MFLDSNTEMPGTFLHECFLRPAVRCKKYVNIMLLRFTAANIPVSLFGIQVLKFYRNIEDVECLPAKETNLAIEVIASILQESSEPD